MLGDEAFRLAKEAKDITTDHIPAYNEEQVRLVTQETRYLWTRIEDMYASLNPSIGTQQEQQRRQQTGSGPAEPAEQLPASSQTHATQQPFSQQPPLDGAMDSQEDDSQIEHRNSISGQTTLYAQTLARNKRCLLAYHDRRARFLRSLLWTLHLAPSLVPGNLLARMSPDEQTYMREYAKLNSAYRDAVEAQLIPSGSLDWAANGDLPPRDPLIEVRVVKDCGEVVTENGVVSLQAGTQHYVSRADVEHLITIGYLEHVSPC
ncbi:DNA replication protein psf1 [Coemansia sp. RSA 1813]|nr:DNA replication protein psf1 [Coemansia sp. RSA 1646]KAJ1769166.1 DNA replication protein psf1 [Coemansia sp. RSA 1843]KAJ2215614.1 DNA replication protein psf1 [Coemansia sp. RSA 487]KAJ2568805.1 DNA replication protein psf1 [Coemansia sp. RSA 1813]